MKISTWNINGIRARKESLHAWIGRHLPDILVLQELKALETEIPDMLTSIEGYRKFWNGSSFRKGYSGVGIMVREESCPEVLLEVPSFDVENRTLILHTPRFSVIGTYVPRGDSPDHYAVKLRYMEELTAGIAGLLASGREVVLAGDMNVALRDIDVHRSQNKPEATGLRTEERSALEACLALRLSDIVRELNPEQKDLFTWWPNWKFARERNLGWRIDGLYLSPGLVGKVSGVTVDLDERSSDHAPVTVTLAL